MAIPLSSSSSRWSYNAISINKTSSYSYLKAQVSRSLLSQPLQLNVSSSNLSVLDAEEEVNKEGDVKTGEETNGSDVVSEVMMMKKSRPCELYVCNIPRSYDIAQLLEMFQPFGTIISVEVVESQSEKVSTGINHRNPTVPCFLRQVLKN